MRLETNGQPYENFVTLEHGASIKEFGRWFSFTSTQDPNTFPFSAGNTCRITVNNIPVLTGNIERIEPEEDSSDNTISIEGRSKVSVLIDSTLDDVNINPGATLKSVIETVIDVLGADIRVINKVMD